MRNSLRHYDSATKTWHTLRETNDRQPGSVAKQPALTVRFVTVTSKDNCRKLLG